MDVRDELLGALKSEGFKARLVPAGRAADLAEEIEDLRRSVPLDDKFYETYLGGFRSELLGALPGARSILIIAMPQPESVLIFDWKGKRQRAILPPTYLTGASRGKATEVVESVLKPRGYSFASFQAMPKKLLAARSGLSHYGRNNISYIQGMGSYYFLYTLATDLDADCAPWQEPRRMEECGRCRACVKNCPTGCISEGRDLIRAERCLTYFNESVEPFPGWIDKGWHNALIGCMRCQTVCPANKGLLKTAEIPDAFTEEEIELLLTEKSFDALPEKTRETLKALELEYAFRDGTLTRNLRALISAAEPHSDE